MNYYKKVVFVLLFFSLSLVGVLCASDEYIIGEEDIIEISVWKNPELSKVVVVRPDGMISLPLIDDIQAKGMTALQLRDKLIEKLTKFIEVPDITVTLREINSYKVYVIYNGQGQSGEFTLKRNVNLLQFFAKIGGIKDIDLKQSYILRDNQKIDVDMNKLIDDNDLTQNIELKPNDTFFFQDKFFSRITVIGQVQKPGIVSYRKGLTLVDVILESGGVTDFARSSGTKVIRKADGEEKVIKVDMADILEDGEIDKNIPVEPGDTVIVPKGFL